MEIKKIAVIGAGQMGRGIAQVAAQSGFQTALFDISDKSLSAARRIMADGFSKMVAKGKLDVDTQKAIMGRLQTTVTLSDVFSADFVIEAATENREIKKNIFAELDRHLKPTVIIASNTSSIPITELGSYTKRPSQVIGMHFMNPVPLMSLVEVIMGIHTSADTLNAVLELSKKMGKDPIVAKKDYAGFIVNRLVVPFINEAVWLVHDGMGSVEDIDKGVRLGLNHPMGPLTLADFIGLDTVLSILEIMHRDYGDPKYRPCPLLRQMVVAGNLGKKTGSGFYNYNV